MYIYMFIYRYIHIYMSIYIIYRCIVLVNITELMWWLMDPNCWTPQKAQKAKNPLRAFGGATVPGGMATSRAN